MPGGLNPLHRCGEGEPAPKDVLARLYAADPYSGELASMREELSARYAGNVLALEEVRVFDPTSGYRANAELFIKAIREGDYELAEELDVWFVQNFPEIQKRDNQFM